MWEEPKKSWSCAVAGVLVLLMGSCAPATTPVYQLPITGNTIQVPISAFNDSNFMIAHDEQNRNDIFISRTSPLAYDAVHMLCTFDKKPLEVVSDGLRCPVCNSVYNLDGVVETGPATTPILKFPTEVNNNTGIITVNIQALKL